MKASKSHIHWRGNTNLKKSAKNTAICLLGCFAGDNLTILWFQWYHAQAPMAFIMVTAMLMGLLTSIMLETLILLKQMDIPSAIKVALGMSFISMLVMEACANITSILLAGGNRLILTWWALLPSWIIGFLSAWAYNYYKLKKYGKSCHGS